MVPGQKKQASRHLGRGCDLIGPEKLMPRYCPPRGFLDQSGRFGRRPPRPAQDAMDVRFRHPGSPGKLTRRETGRPEDGAEVVHPYKGNTLALTVQGQGSYFVKPMGSHNLPMARYVQQPALKAAVRAYQDRTGKKQEEVARELGTTLGTLHQWLNNKNRRPELENLQKISALTRVSVSEFIDDPGADYAGHDLSQESEETRFLAKMVIKGARAKDLTDEQKIFILQDTERAIERALLASARDTSVRGADHPGAKPDLQPGPATSGPRRTPRPKR